MTVDAKREGGFVRLAALAASNDVQSRSVLAILGDSPGVRGDGDGGREEEADGGLDPRILPPSLENSELSRGERVPGFWPVAEPAGDTPREDE